MDDTVQPSMPPYVIEAARSGRSRCKTCRRKIDKGALRIGMLIEGPYGTGYLWHHLRCAARRRIEQVEEAYRLEAWREANEPPKRIPDLDELRRQVAEAEQRRERKPTLPYAEIDPSGRARCKHCGEPMPKGSVRVVLGRRVEFGNQVRTGPVQVHPRCVAAELRTEHCATTADGFAEALRVNSSTLETAAVDRLLDEIGPV